MALSLTTGGCSVIEIHWSSRGAMISHERDATDDVHARSVDGQKTDPAAVRREPRTCQAVVWVVEIVASSAASRHRRGRAPGPPASGLLQSGRGSSLPSGDQSQGRPQSSQMLSGYSSGRRDLIHGPFRSLGNHVENARAVSA